MYAQISQMSRVPRVPLLRVLAAGVLALLLSASIPGVAAISKVEAPVAPAAGAPASVIASLPVPLLAAGQTATSTVYVPYLACSRCGSGNSTWPMAGANPQRTSWVPEQVPSAEYLADHRRDWNPGMLYVQWAKPIEPYISNKVQIIAAYNMLYISTASGLYALDSDTGSVNWVYPTELPLGNSPTIYKGLAYVGGLDHKIYAIDARTGELKWTYEATQGFETNPVVVNGILYAGSRDGYLYAIYVEGANTGQLDWKYQTGGPILYSAAYQDGVVYFASDDDYAYALDANTGALVWKSAKFPGAGFHSWWPVVYGDVVIFSGSQGYRDSVRPGVSGCNCNLDTLDRRGVFPNADSAPRGTPVGTRGADGWIDATPIKNYLQAKPWRRSYFVLNRSNGQEVIPYAPILWQGTQSGNRFPPIVAGDGIIYQANDFMSAPSINGGGPSGWRIGTNYISTPTAHWFAVDEPLAMSAGGNLVYWVYHNNISAGGFDTTVPNTRFWDNSGTYGPNIDVTRDWVYWDNNALSNQLPGFDVAENGVKFGPFGGPNGVYERNGDQDPLVPYQGKAYVIRGNAVIALVPETPPATRTVLPVATTTPVTPASPTVDVNALKAKLAAEVQKILAAGHLRPGYLSSGHVDNQLIHACGDNMQDYFHDPSDTLYTLIQALPYLDDPTLLQNTKTYLQTEFNAYKPYQVNHVGWATGLAREAADLPPDILPDAQSFSASATAGYDFVGWGGGHGGTGFPPHMFYVLWKYAQTFPGTATTIYNASKNLLSPVPTDPTVLQTYPFVHNSYIAGYLGYLNLQAAAGYTRSGSVHDALNALVASRIGGFSKDTPYSLNSLCRVLSVSRNFIFLVPELADAFRADPTALGKVDTAVAEYSRIAPFWFVSAYEDSVGEGMIEPLYDVNALFQARALILQDSAPNLAKYLDVPAFQQGDLFYIQNLVAVLYALDQGR